MAGSTLSKMMPNSLTHLPSWWQWQLQGLYGVQINKSLIFELFFWMGGRRSAVLFCCFSGTYGAALVCYIFFFHFASWHFSIHHDHTSISVRSMLVGPTNDQVKDSTLQLLLQRLIAATCSSSNQGVICFLWWIIFLFRNLPGRRLIHFCRHILFLVPVMSLS